MQVLPQILSFSYPFRKLPSVAPVCGPLPPRPRVASFLTACSYRCFLMPPSPPSRSCPHRPSICGYGSVAVVVLGCMPVPTDRDAGCHHHASTGGSVCHFGADGRDAIEPPPVHLGAPQAGHRGAFGVQQCQRNCNDIYTPVMQLRSTNSGMILSFFPHPFFVFSRWWRCATAVPRILGHVLPRSGAATTRFG